jgi:glycosyltransferase involved in cell wall biosynthesis
LIRNEAIGIEYPPDDPIALADALLVLSTDHELRTAMGTRARAAFERDFVAEAVYSDFADHVAFVASKSTNG